MTNTGNANTTVRIEEQYHGFPGIAMGGFAGGLVARRVGNEVAVTFRRPIPTGETLEIAETGGGAELRIGGDVAASATATDVDVDPPNPVSLEDAEGATQSYPGHRKHPYPSCFTCGPDRHEGDGLRIFPARVGERPAGWGASGSDVVDASSEPYESRWCAPA